MRVHYLAEHAERSRRALAESLGGHAHNSDVRLVDVLDYAGLGARDHAGSDLCLLAHNRPRPEGNASPK